MSLASVLRASYLCCNTAEVYCGPRQIPLGASDRTGRPVVSQVSVSNPILGNTCPVFVGQRRVLSTRNVSFPLLVHTLQRLIPYQVLQRQLFGHHSHSLRSRHPPLPRSGNHQEDMENTVAFKSPEHFSIHIQVLFRRTSKDISSVPRRQLGTLS